MAYEIEVSEHAANELSAQRTYEQRILVVALRELIHDAETVTRNRRPLRSPLEGLPEAAWQLRVGKYRVFYEVIEGRIVRVLRVIIKRRTTAESL